MDFLHRVMGFPIGDSFDGNFELQYQYGDTMGKPFEFEAKIYTILPAAILLFLCPFHLFCYARAPVVVDRGSLLWLKLIGSFTLVCSEIVKGLLWSVQADPRTNIITAVAITMACGAALALATMLGIEHRRSLQSSTLLSVYLSVAVFLDVSETRSFLRQSLQFQNIAVMTAVTALLKLSLLILQEFPKQRNGELQENQNPNPEENAGFWNRTLVLWLNSTLLLGFHKRLTVNDLADLGPDYSSRRLAAKFEAVWAGMDKTLSNALLKACLEVLFWPLLAATISRFLLAVFSLSLPFLIERVLQFLGANHPPDFVRTGLMGATVVMFFGVGVIRASYGHLINRACTFLRGMLMAQIIKKNLALNHSDAKRAAILTLMSDDIDGVVNGMEMSHNNWVGAFEIAASMYCLSTTVGKACFVSVIPVLISSIIIRQLGKSMASAVTRWKASIEKRITKTAIIISQLKGIKMIGLERIMTNYVHGLRVAEMDAAKESRNLRAISVSAMAINFWGTPFVVFCSGLFWTTFTDGLDPASTFTTMALINLLNEPILLMLNYWHELETTFVCLDRIQTFLLLEERQDPRQIQDICEFGGSDVENTKRQPIISFTDVSIGSKSAEKNVLQHIQLSVCQGTLVFVMGAIGAGKSLFLQSLLGEVPVKQGLIQIAQQTFAFCGQKVWLPNTTIQAAVIGENEFDQKWYDTVMQACALDDALKLLKNGDRTMTGTHGSLLSAGEAHRIAIARAVYSRASVVVLDDVLSVMDDKTARIMFSRLLSAQGLLKAHGRTTIMATHSMRHLDSCDQIITVDDSGNICVTNGKEKLPFIQEDPSMLPTIKEEDNEPLPVKDVTLIKSAQDLEFETMTNETLQGDLSIYGYFLTSVPPYILAIFFTAVILVGLLETLPIIYIRIWVGVAPQERNYVFGLIPFGLLDAACNGFTVWFYMTYIAPKIALAMHRAFLDTVMRATIPYLTSANTGDLLNRFSRDMTLIGQELPTAFYRSSYVIFIVLIESACISAATTHGFLLIPATLTLLYILQVFYLKTSQRMMTLDSEAKTPLYTILNETISGLQHIRAFGWQHTVLERSLDLLDMSQKTFYYNMSFKRWLLLVLDQYILIVATLLVALGLYWPETVTQAGLGMALALLTGYNQTLKKSVMVFTDLETSVMAVARLRAFVHEAPSEEDSPDAIRQAPNWPSEGVVEMKQVGATYSNPTDKPVVALENVTIKAAVGERTVIRGRTGSGKTSAVLTLLNALEYTGSITIDGVEIRNIPRDQLRSIITTMPQEPIDIPGSVLDNLLPLDILKEPGDGIVHDVAICAILDGVGLAQHIADRGGLDAPIEEMEFSYGQRQLLGIARAMLHKLETGSKIILMDEPTSGLDHATERYIQSLMDDLFHDCTRIVATHRPSGYTDADIIFTLRKGKVSSKLEFKKLLADGIFAAED